MRNFRVYEAKVSLTEHLVRSDPQFQAVYDAVLVQAAIFVIYVFVNDFWVAGSPSVGLNQVLSFVGDSSTLFYFLCLESYLLLCSLAVYPVFLVGPFPTCLSLLTLPPGSRGHGATDTDAHC
jgi:hypothetical protein